LVGLPGRDPVLVGDAHEFEDRLDVKAQDPRQSPHHSVVRRGFNQITSPTFPGWVQWDKRHGLLTL